MIVRFCNFLCALVFATTSCVPQQQPVLPAISPNPSNGPINSTNNTYSEKCRLTATPQSSSPNRPITLSVAAGSEIVSATIDNKPVQMPNGNVTVYPGETTEFVAIVRDRAENVFRCSTTVNIAGI